MLPSRASRAALESTEVALVGAVSVEKKGYICAIELRSVGRCPAHD